MLSDMNSLWIESIEIEVPFHYHRRMEVKSPGPVVHISHVLHWSCNGLTDSEFHIYQFHLHSFVLLDMLLEKQASSHCANEVRSH